MATQLKSVDQLGMDEQIIEDAEVEAALEEREKRKASLTAVRKVYDGAHEAAVAEISKLELPEGGGCTGRAVPDHAGRHPGAERHLRHEGVEPAADLARGRGARSARER